MGYYPYAVILSIGFPIYVRKVTKYSIHLFNTRYFVTFEKALAQDMSRGNPTLLILTLLVPIRGEPFPTLLLNG
jgi:hypothetical protein